jgi:hypothetical protein
MAGSACRPRASAADATRRVKGLLNDVVDARLVRAEPPHVAMQSLSVARVELADRGVGVAKRITKGASVFADIYYP